MGCARRLTWGEGMRYINTETINGIERVPIYKPDELPRIEITFAGIRKNRHNINYLNVATAFDIETTNIYKKDYKGRILTELRPYAYMYHWQYCIADYVVFGRTWEEFAYLLEYLRKTFNLSNSKRMVIYVHNLAFEFQFLFNLFPMTEVFCKNVRKPLKALMLDCFELRCSYFLSNMSLSKFCENTPGCRFYKLIDTYDYSKIRTPFTPMLETEEGYCYNDVRGLAECIKFKMQEDDLAHIPLTSTGYVRRDYRKAMAKNRHNRERFLNTQLSPKLYNVSRETFRGGDVHANLRFVNQIVTNVKSKDKQSSYPASMMMDDFPVGKFFKINAATFISRNWEHYAYYIHIRLVKVKYIGNAGMPYIPLAKCNKISPDYINDNGRILYADYLEIRITDIDWKIIRKDYSWKDIYFNDVFISEYGELPAEFKSNLMYLFTAKTKLKGIIGQEYEYMRSKNKVNASYGMMVTDIAQGEIEFDNGEYRKAEMDVAKALEQYYKSRNSFLSYQHGVWVTANARYNLHKGIWITGKDTVYVDTDSDKYINDHEEEFAALNAEIIEKAKKYNAYAEDKNGKVQWLGVWDDDGEYDEFKTLGAKKYIVKQDGEYKTTIAGVSKKAGKEFFNKHGIRAFKIGTEIPDCGHLVAYYNNDQPHLITETDYLGQPATFTTASNVALIDGGYKIGVTDEYMELLEKAIDNIE